MSGNILFFRIIFDLEIDPLRHVKGFLDPCPGIRSLGKGKIALA